MKWTLHRLLEICILMLVFCCGSNVPEKKFKIGFSQCTGGDAWRRQMLSSMERELAFHPEMELEYRDAANSNIKQIKDIEELLRSGIDLLIVSPNESDPITPVIEEVFKKGIPVIVVDRRTSSNLYSSFIGADNYEIGKLAGSYIARLLNGRGKIVEIWGLRGSSPAIDRHKGFIEVIQNYPNISVVKEIDGSWELDSVKVQMGQAIRTLEPVDLVFAHNDIMAYGAHLVCNAYDANTQIRFVGIDGLPGPGAGIQFVNDHILDATFLYPTGGEEAILLAARIMNRQNFEKENILYSVTIDQKNVRVMKAQTEIILSQQKDIQLQYGKINEQIRIYQNQRNLIYLLLFSLMIAIVAGSRAFFAWREKKEMNLRLNKKKDEIQIQRDRIQEMASRAEAETQQKLKFFTDISHELRTPLTLILDPIEELLQAEKNTPPKKENLKLAKKNALRLLNLVNQLMDFRKIDDRKMLVQVSENDIVLFIREIMSDFEKIAKKRRIDFRLITELKKLNIWFDRDKIDKVIFNLLSNAFKFTNDDGYIYIKLSSFGAEGYAVLSIEDNGKGMSEDNVKHLFERFFSGDGFANTGTGLGLALCKEYLELHHSNISVSSEPFKGTRFHIMLKLGASHFKDAELAEAKMEFQEHTDHSLLLDESEIQSDFEREEIDEQKEFSILLIDDSKELRDHLGHRLKRSYQIIEAADGLIGLQKAFDNVPDLIICDVILPGKGGFEVARMLRNDLRTSHIPIIMLTAKTSFDQRIEGLHSGVDAYVTKPFVFNYLNERIKTLIQNRILLRQHYIHDLGGETGPKTRGGLDKKFINSFISIVEANLSNSDFNMDDIAKGLGMSRVQVYRKAKALLGNSVNDYIINVRLKTAKYLLTNTDKSISEIGYEVGFSSPAYFSSSFRAKFNLSPSEFKSSKTAQS